MISSLETHLEFVRETSIARIVQAERSTSMSQFMRNNSFECFDFNILPNDSFTYVGFGHSNCRWLDHFIGRSSSDVGIREIDILYDLIGSDNFPIVAT